MPTELNPADHASRGIKASETEKLERWRHGPEFLWREAGEWPHQSPAVLEDLLDSDEGVKKTKVTVGAAIVQNSFWSDMFQRYSSWNRLRRIVAWLIRVIRKPKDPKLKLDISFKSAPRTLSVLELDVSEKMIVKFVQKQSFASETEELVMKSRLARLRPFMDQDIIRVGGRLKHSDLQYDAKHPMILPRKHPVSELIVRHYHQSNGHIRTYQVLAEIRQRFWIVNAVSTIKRVLSKCQVCKRQNAKVGEQVTAPLPIVRVSSDSKRLIYPFAAVGLDYFGPLYVKTGPNTRSRKFHPFTSGMDVSSLA